jgi:hypothetical protein
MPRTRHAANFLNGYMKSTLSVGVALADGSLAVASCQSGQPTTQALFPATAIGVEAIRIFLDHCGEPVRLAVKAAHLSFAVRWTNGRGHETFVVSSRVRDDPLALARYAEHAM